MGSRLLEKCTTFLFDLLSFSIAFITTFWLRYQSNIFPETFDPTLQLSSYYWPLVILSSAWLVLFFFTGLYRDWYKESRLDEFFVVSRTVVIGIALFFLILCADELVRFVLTGIKPVLLTKTQFATLSTYGGCMLFFATLNRFTMHTLFAYFFARGIGVKNVLVIGAGDDGHKLVHEMRRYPQLGYRIVGFIDDDGRKRGTSLEGLPVFGTYSDISHVVKKEHIAGLIVSRVSESPNEILKIITYCGDVNVVIYMVPTLVDVISGHLKTHQIFGIPLMVLLKDHMPGWEAQIKRLIDIAMSLAVLGLGLPVWLLIAAVIRWRSPGNVIYRQERIGRNGKPFIMLKFRSMYPDAEKYSGPVWAQARDPRVTPVGRFLRTTRLDEIPQFINVLKGEMSLVGPRPERAFFIEELKKEIPWYIRRIKMKPGITGWAQIKHKYDASIDDVRQKVLYDLYYFENMSLILDLKIMIRTILVVLTGKGAH
jgi:exopolysaccharide biosynthesis polyprenyl glycosylphosphotransferase